MNELYALFVKSGMSNRDYAYALGVAPNSMARFLNGQKEPPAGLVDDAFQLDVDIDFAKAVIKANPGLEYVSYKVFKLLLDTKVEQD